MSDRGGSVCLSDTGWPRLYMQVYAPCSASVQFGRSAGFDGSGSGPMAVSVSWPDGSRVRGGDTLGDFSLCPWDERRYYRYVSSRLVDLLGRDGHTWTRHWYRSRRWHCRASWALRVCRTVSLELRCLCVEVSCTPPSLFLFPCREPRWINVSKRTWEWKHVGVKECRSKRMWVELTS